jgi:hypothetical protein
MALTQVSPGLLDTTAQYYGFKNRIINGATNINQRGFTSSTAAVYTVDRWSYERTLTSGTYTATTSTDAPAGFSSSIQIATTTAYSSFGASDFIQFTQFIEGLNIIDLAWGTSSAQPVTVSFWFKATQTGTYSVNLANDTGLVTYPSSITVIAANTWEYKTVTIPGPTIGTWQTNNTQGIGLRIGAIYGSFFTTGTVANTWGTRATGFQSGFVATTNNMASTVGAYFRITGVQLEKGSTATSFDYRPYGTELVLCQRYYFSAGVYQWLSRPTDADPNLKGTTRYAQTMRATPTITNTASATVGTDAITSDYVTWTRGASGVAQVYTFTASAEL